MPFDIKEALTHKIGPLPTVVWVAIPAGAYVAYSYYRSATGGSSTDTTTDMPTTEDSFDTGYPSIPEPDEPPSSNRPPVENNPYTNRDWERDAIGWAIGQGLNPLDATTAVRAYLYGRPSAINQSQMNVLRQIITARGAAPSGGNIPPLVRNPDNRPPNSNSAPKPPSNVGLRHIQGKLQATWNASPTANARYEVEHKRDRGPWMLIKSTELNHIEFEAREGAHTIRVRARNRHGYSNYVQSPVLTIAKSTQPRTRERAG